MDMVRNAKARWNAGAPARKAAANRFKAMAAHVGKAASGYAKIPGTPVNANMKVANAAKAAVTANNRVINNPVSTAAVIAAATANNNLNMAMKAATVHNKNKIVSK